MNFQLSLRSIGIVKNEVSETVDDNWGEVVSEIQFTHVIVIFYMHQSSFDARSDLIRRPRGREDMPAVGIFAQRAKHRPNPIGVTTVKLLEVYGAVLRVKGLDAVDGTPVLDIKPYFPVFDRRDDATVPAWVERLMEGYF
ncbi:tRNA (N6-threonylcarbamoyladenosine(37)-N6)-methyltransferase TrmO [Effusibacillus consociatus]|uniref:tRNA (N6-threonylcarbamoyladenosine(37)-N6)-methyltransferase TrmO n=1 Tax=Effusibacillus consociatus TaxID=1117041 RepID=A0ABV9PX64_9BACL